MRRAVLTTDPALAAAVADLARDQGGVVARPQLLALGIRSGAVRSLVRGGSWQQVHRGVYASFTGPLPPLARVVAAVLACGDGAVAAGWTALWLAGLREPHGGRRPIQVAVSHPRRVRPPDGVRVRRRRAGAVTAAAACPPRLCVEEAVCDVVAVSTDPAEVIAVVTQVVQQRLTTPPRLRAELRRRRRQRHRRLLVDLLTDLEEGIRSPLERRFRHDVVRAHGLPMPTFNARETEAGGATRYRDARFGFGVLAELDGRAAHPDGEAFRDRERDNRAALEGDLTLRFGWHEVVGRPCEVAADVARALTRRGWAGSITACGPSCRAVEPG